MVVVEFFAAVVHANSTASSSSAFRLVRRRVEVREGWKIDHVARADVVHGIVAFGILLGIGVGNIFSLVLNTGFVIPWNWVIYGIVICTVVGLIAGIFPALKAGKLNPIEALRYE